MKPTRQFIVGSAVAAATLFSTNAASAQDRATEEVETEGAFTFEVSAVVDVLSVVSGGIERDAAVLYAGNFITELSGAAIGLPSTRFHVDLQYVGGDALSGDLVGDAQGVSNIEAYRALRPLEIWVEHAFGPSGQGAVKAGIIDLNADFDVQSVGSLFLNGSHGIGAEYAQTGQNGPSIFPTTTSAAILSWNAQRWAIRGGAFNAVAGNPDRPGRTVVKLPGADGLLLAGEIDFSLESGTLLRLGGWHYTSEFDRLDIAPAGSAGRSNRGVYAMAERDVGPVGAWIRVGRAAGRYNLIRDYVGGGVTLETGAGEAGFAVAHARLGDPGARALADEGVRVRRAETNFEATFALPVGPLTVQPNVQYVVNPAWDGALGDALVAGFRFSYP